MMEQLPENNPGQSENPAATAATSLGRTLRETREHLGMSVADVANQIKFAPRQIEALEADDFQHLPEATFLRGFIRSYAKILQLDAQPLLAALPQTKAASMELAPASVGVPFPGAPSLLRQNQFWLYAAALLAVIAGGFALWNFMSPLQQPEVEQVETPLPLPAEVQIIPVTPVPDASMTAPAVADMPKRRSTATKAQSSVPATKTQAAGDESQVQATKPVPKSVAPSTIQPAKPETRPETEPETKPESEPVTITPAPTAKSATQSDKLPPVTQLRLEFGEESWTEIKDRDGKIISSQVNPAGSELTVYGRAPFTMLIGHGFAARLYHQGKQVDLTPYINKYSEVAHVTLK